LIFVVFTNWGLSCEPSKLKDARIIWKECCLIYHEPGTI